ncbi:MAG: fimbria/pilus periplasmic chaperone [Cyanobacteria bacterium P01_G01_bin.38]
MLSNIWKCVLSSLMGSCLGLGLLKAAPAQAIDIAVSPYLFQLDLDESNLSESMRVFNMGSDPVTLQVSVHSWILDENNEVALIPPAEQSLDQWIVLNPSRFSIAPGEAQTIRFAIRPRSQPETGEHRAIIYLTEVPTETEQTSLQTIGRLGVAVYGYAGEVSREGVLHSIQVTSAQESAMAVFDIASQGSAHVRLTGQYAVWQADTYPGAEVTTTLNNLDTIDLDSTPELPTGIVKAGLLPSSPVLPDTRRQIPFVVNQLPPGQYILDLNGELEGVAIDQGIPFTVR